MHHLVTHIMEVYTCKNRLLEVRERGFPFFFFFGFLRISFARSKSMYSLFIPNFDTSIMFKSFGWR